MSESVTARTSEKAPAARASTGSPVTQDRLNTGDGQISVADNVVQKIAGTACREVAGVHAMGSPARGRSARSGTASPAAQVRTSPRAWGRGRRDRGRDRPGHRGRLRREHRRAGPQYPAERQAGGGADDRPAGRRGQRRRGRRLPARHRRPGQHARRACHDPPPASSCPQPRSSMGLTWRPSPRRCWAALASPRSTAAGSARSRPTCPVARCRASWSAAAGC